MSDPVVIENDEHWHRLRAKHVGGSEVAALFDRSPYQTRFTLWHTKAGTVAPRDIANDRTEWGKRLEAGIAEGVSADMRWNLRKAREYHTSDSVSGMGCTIDYDVTDHADGPGIVEIKFVAEYVTWKTDWTEKRGPPCFELQLQHQLACTGCPWGALAVFIGQTATLHIYERKLDPRVVAEIGARVTAFWASIAAGQSPEAFGTAQEWDLLQELYPEIDAKKSVTVPDERLSETAQMFAWASGQRRSGERTEAECKVKLLDAMGDAQAMILPHYIVRQRPHGKGRVITVHEAETGVAHDLAPVIELA